MFRCGVTPILELVPIDAHVHEAQYVAHEHRPQRDQRAEIGVVRNFEFQHHDGDDDGDDAVAEGFQSILTHPIVSLISSIPLQTAESMIYMRSLQLREPNAPPHEFLAQVALVQLDPNVAGPRLKVRHLSRNR